MLVLTCAVALALAACGGDDDDDDASAGPGEVGAPAATQEDLLAHPWQLRSYAVSGADDMTAAPAASPATAAFTETEVGGTTGCNNYTTTYELTADGAISFSPIASTLKACEDSAINAQEQAVLDGLSNAKQAVIEDGALQLLDKDANPLLFFEEGNR
jgi:heat shock protein HslJ